jgi:hypothetical protein
VVVGSQHVLLDETRDHPLQNPSSSCLENLPRPLAMMNPMNWLETCPKTATLPTSSFGNVIRRRQPKVGKADPNRRENMVEVAELLMMSLLHLQSEPLAGLAVKESSKT